MLQLPDKKLIARRSFLAGLASALAAPAVVRASSLMPVRALSPNRFIGMDLAVPGSDSFVVFGYEIEWRTGETKLLPKLVWSYPGGFVWNDV